MAELSQPEHSDSPRGDAQRIALAITVLYSTYVPQGVGVWLQGAKTSLGGRSPLDLLAAGDVDAFCAACERTEGMIAT